MSAGVGPRSGIGAGGFQFRESWVNGDGKGTYRNVLHRPMPLGVNGVNGLSSVGVFAAVVVVQDFNQVRRGELDCAR